MASIRSYIDAIVECDLDVFLHGPFGVDGLVATLKGKVDGAVGHAGEGFAKVGRIGSTVCVVEFEFLAPAVNKERVR